MADLGDSWNQVAEAARATGESRSVTARPSSSARGASVVALALLLVAMSALWVGCGSGVRSGATAPGFVGTTLNGINLSLGQYQGKPVVLAFMASW